MSGGSSNSSGDCGFDQWMRDTLIFRQWEDTKREIQNHKWYKSEQAGHDIGWERATVDWMINYGLKSRKGES